MAKKDPAFLFYPKDWLEGTAEMHPNEKGVYIDLLCYQHQKGDLPTDTSKLARLVRLSVSDFTEIWNSISIKFETKGERTYNKRLNDEINDRSTRAHKNKVVGWFSAYLRTHELNKAQYSLLKKTFKTDDFNNIPNDRLNECINEWCNERLKSIEDANEDANANSIIIDNSKCTPEGLALVKYIETLSNVSKVKNQLTCEEANRLMTEFPKDKIKDILTAMENRANLVKNNLSVNLTIRKWIKNNFNNPPSTIIPSGVTAN
jgi:uncharacterized protein YdaU (DUF1376 family)